MASTREQKPLLLPKVVNDEFAELLSLSLKSRVSSVRYDSCLVLKFVPRARRCQRHKTEKILLQRKASLARGYSWRCWTRCLRWIPISGFTSLLSSTSLPITHTVCVFSLLFFLLVIHLSRMLATDSVFTFASFSDDNYLIDQMTMIPTGSTLNAESKGPSLLVRERWGRDAPWAFVVRCYDIHERRCADFPLDRGMSLESACLDPTNANRLFVCGARLIFSIENGRTTSIAGGNDGVAMKLVDDPIGERARFGYDLMSVVCDASASVLYVADSENHRIRSVDVHSTAVDTVAGGGLQYCSFIAATVMVGKDAFVKFPRALCWEVGPRAVLSGGPGLYIGSDDGIRRLDLKSGQLVYLTTCSRPVKFYPVSMVCTSAGFLVVSCISTQSLYTVDVMNGETKRISGGKTGCANGDVWAEAEYNYPSELARLDEREHTVLLADTNNCRVQCIPLSAELFEARSDATLIIPTPLQLGCPMAQLAAEAAYVSSAAIEYPCRPSLLSEQDDHHATVIPDIGPARSGSTFAFVADLPESVLNEFDD
jgi:hypothetical protein